MAYEQNGTEWYVVKNSWGDSNDYKGYFNEQPFCPVQDHRLHGEQERRAERRNDEAGDVSLLG
ncbi:MAG: hypothetical protein IPH05_09030 [Flavobacteriales bacterium]|nr:hypothetical protein [Flavobacteriales bacterium]MBK6551511.1 hypothetical protein [Flavobacteriales bacterium]MBK6883068.1 hypothetical protein [Flavobacteriales bacterium]MBK7103492.1 hypothetical protein [Flavobacteriales bacterium]MBK7112450.1 hypothetical protein [Flavobacteriales bacterium]